MKAFGHLWTLVSSHCLRWISHGHQGMPLLDAIGHSAIVLVNPSRPTFSDTSVLYVEEGCSPWEMQNAKSDREKASMRCLPWPTFSNCISSPKLSNSATKRKPSLQHLSFEGTVTDPRADPQQITAEKALGKEKGRCPLPCANIF